MPEDRKNLPDTRMIFMGDSALANGFRLAGFDVYPDADDTVLDALLRELRETRQRAFVVLDGRLA
ncbi:MAG: ATPase, partial [Gammaproteobacteria bacterium]